MVTNALVQQKDHTCYNLTHPLITAFSHKWKVQQSHIKLVKFDDHFEHTSSVMFVLNLQRVTLMLNCTLWSNSTQIKQLTYFVVSVDAQPQEKGDNPNSSKLMEASSSLKQQSSFTLRQLGP